MFFIPNMGLLAYARRNGRREDAFDAIANRLSNDTNDKFRAVEQFDLDHPYASGLGVALVADATTNGGEFTGQTIELTLDFDGPGEFGDILAESNDVLFNWADMTMEAGKGAASSVAGETSDGNLLYGAFDLGSYITEGLTDIEEHLANFVTGEGWTDSGPEWYDNLGAEGESEPVSQQHDYHNGSEPGVENSDNPTESTETPTESTETPTESTETPGDSTGETEGSNPGEVYGDINGYDVFETDTVEGLEGFFAEEVGGEPDSLEVNFEGADNGAGEYILEADGHEYSLENLDGEEIQEVVTAKDGNLEDLFNEFYSDETSRSSNTSESLTGKLGGALASAAGSAKESAENYVPAI
jgi:hypothetical protein